MDFFDSIHGNDKQKNFFRSRIEEGKLSHAYILEAPQGGGKKMFALRIAATLASLEKTSPKERDEKCRRILEGLSPDVRILSRSDDGKKTIGVSAVRDFMASVYLAPSELGFKMYLFDEADRITPQAQNALLKVIEEPCKNVYLFLLCENSLSMLATVRSRAQKILLQTFGEQELAVLVVKLGHDGGDLGVELVEREDALGMREIEIELDLPRSGKRMDHVGHCTNAVQAIERVQGLRAVGHTDGDAVALFDAHGEKRLRCLVDLLHELREGRLFAHEFIGRQLRIALCCGFDHLIDGLLRIRQMMRHITVIF